MDYTGLAEQREWDMHSDPGDGSYNPPPLPDDLIESYLHDYDVHRLADLVLPALPALQKMTLRLSYNGFYIWDIVDTNGERSLKQTVETKFTQAEY